MVEAQLASTPVATEESTPAALGEKNPA
jgi:hypothetical protein